MPGSISIAMLLKAIRSLPADPPINDPEKWYRTQKEHWIGWFSSTAAKEPTAVRLQRNVTRSMPTTISSNLRCCCRQSVGCSVGCTEPEPLPGCSFPALTLRVLSSYGPVNVTPSHR